MRRIAIVLAAGVVVAGLWMGASVAQTGQQTGQKGRGGEPVPGQADKRREKDVIAPHHIPSFMQAGRSYVFDPVVGETFSGKVVSLDSTGWVQVQLRPGGDVGSLAEWYNLANMVSIKAMN